MFKTFKQRLKINSQDGFAAIIISMIILAIIGLLVLGFASNTINNQKISLDNALSTQAYYDAESGINDAYNIISAYEKGGLSLVNLPSNLNSCVNNNPYIEANSNQLDKNNSYSCLLVNLEPYSLEFKPVTQFNGESFPLQEPPSFSPNMQVLNISWQAHNPSSLNFSGCSNSVGKFLTTTAYNMASCTAPVLQVDITPANNLNNSSFSNMISHTLSFYLQPLNNTSNNPNPVSATNGSVLPANCSINIQPGFEFNCYDRILLPSSTNGTYYVHLLPIYSDADISVSANYNNSINSNVPLFSAQALIDSTGDSSGVFRRLEERICISTICDNSVPAGAIISNSQICKQFTSRPGVITDRSSGLVCPTP